MKKREETDLHHNEDIYNLDIYSTRKQNCSTEQWKISCLTSKSNLPLKTTLIMIDWQRIIAVASIMKWKHRCIPPKHLRGKALPPPAHALLLLNDYPVQLNSWYHQSPLQGNIRLSRFCVRNTKFCTFQGLKYNLLWPPKCWCLPLGFKPG